MHERDTKWQEMVADKSSRVVTCLYIASQQIEYWNETKQYTASTTPVWHEGLIYTCKATTSTVGTFVASEWRKRSPLAPMDALSSPIDIYGYNRYNPTDIYEGMRSTSSMFSSRDVSVGNTCSGEIEFTVNGDLRSGLKSAEVRVYVYLTSDSAGNSKLCSKGVYYIDTRKYNPVMNRTTIHAYDAMLKTEQPMIPTGSVGTWPKTPTQAVTEIVQRIGIDGIDSRSGLNDNYSIPMPSTDMSMRDFLGYVGGMHCGNWIITDDNKLRLIPLSCIDQTNLSLLSTQDSKAVDFDTGDNFEFIITDFTGISGSGTGEYTHYVGASARSVDAYALYDAFSKVVFLNGETETYSAGTNTGRTLEIQCPWATQTVANNALALINGKTYQPFEADGAVIDPAAELGDGVIIGGVVSTIASMDISFSSIYTADIGAPHDEEIDHEYPYVTQTEQLRRDVDKAVAQIEVNTSDILLKVSKDSVINAINVSTEGIAINSSKLDISGFVTFSDLSSSGATTINGGNITTGVIDAVDINGVNITGVEISGSDITGSKIVSADEYGRRIQLEYGILHFGPEESPYAGIRLYDQSSAYGTQRSLYIGTGSGTLLYLDPGGGLKIGQDCYGTTLPSVNPNLPNIGRLFFKLDT